MGTSTLADARAFTSQPQALRCAHPSMLSHGHKNSVEMTSPEFVGSALLAILLPLRQRLVALRLRLGEIALRAVHLDTQVAPLEVRLNRRRQRSTSPLSVTATSDA